MNNKTKKRAAFWCAAVIIGALGLFLATFLLPLLGELYGVWIAVGVLLLYAALILAVIVGVLVALRQRLKEIESGEEEEAKKY
ncbi:MAG: hypothetical protein J6R77_00945 [Clostridia bacterium]|nr:hypothetical protein [Clostridia bacterium]